MDFFQSVKNFFTGHGWQDDAARAAEDERNRKKREEEARRRAAEAAKRQVQTRPSSSMLLTPTNNQSNQARPKKDESVEAIPAAQQLGTAPRPTTDMFKMPTSPVRRDPEFNGLSEQDYQAAVKLKREGKQYQKFVEAARNEAKLKQKSDYENSVPGRILNTLGEVGKSIFGNAVDVGSRVVETADQAGTAVNRWADSINPTMSEEERRLRIMMDNKRFQGYKDFRKGSSQFFNGDSRNERGETLAEETDREARNISSGRASAGDVVSAALKSLDLAGFIPVGSLVGRGAKAGKELIEASEPYIDDAIKVMEESIGRKLNPQEESLVRKDLGERVAKEASGETPKAKDAKTVAEAPQEAQDVATSYQTIHNAISNDTNLSSEQKMKLIEEARKRHKELLKQVDEKIEANAKAQEAIVKQADEAAQAEQQQMQQTIANVQEQQAAQAQPTPQQVVQEQPVASPEVQANNAFLQDSADMTAARRAEEERYSQNPLVRLWNAAQRIPDSNAQLQRADNALMKAEGRTYAEGLDPQQDLTRLAQLWQRGNQTTAVAKVNKKYNGTSLADVLKRRTGLGGKNSKSQVNADQFENYTIYKRALEVIEKDGYDPISGSSDPKELVGFAQRYRANTQAYEQTDPQALKDILTLRAVAKDEAKDAFDSGAITPEQFAGLDKYDFYVPFQRTQSEDLIRPEIKGGMVSGLGEQRIVRGMERGANSPISASPADMLDFIRDSQKQVAAQNLASEIVRRAREGLYLPGKAGANRVVVDGRMLAERADAMRRVGELGDEIDVLRKSLRSAKTDKRLVQRELDGRYRQGAEIMRAYFRDQAANPQASGAAAKMSVEELADIFKLAVEAKEVKGKTLLKSIEKREGIQGQLEGAIEAMRNDIKLLKENKADEFQRAVENRQQVELGRNYISLQENGFTTKMEVSPTLMRQLQSLKKQSEPATNVFAKSVNFVNNALKSTYTALNPVFRIVNDFVKNPALMVRNGDVRNILETAGWKQFAISLASAKNQSLNKFRNEALAEGLSLETLMQTRDFAKQTARDYAARQDFFSFFNRNPVHTVKDVGMTLNRFFATVGNAQREAVAAAEYARALRNGLPEQQALRSGVRAANDILGDMNRVNDNVRYLEGISAWLNPTIAGVRALGTAYKRNPIQTAIKDATVLTGLGLVAYNTYNDDSVAREYYERSISENRQHQIENAVNIFLPGAYIDEETGEAHGVIKVPIPPDFRALWRGIQDEAYSITGGEGIDPGVALSAIGRTVTGDIARQAIYDPQAADNDVMAGWLPTFFGGRSAAAAMGFNPNAQGELLDPDNQGATENTSPLAVGLSDLFGLNPVRTDAVLREFGFAGTVARTGDPLESFTKSFNNQFSGGKFDKPGATYYKEMKEIKNAITDLKQRRTFEMLHQKRTAGAQLAKELGIDAPAGQSNSGMLDSSMKALALLSNEEVLNAEMTLTDRAKARGEPTNPLFDREALTPEQRNAILTYRQGKIYNAAGQNRDKNDETAFTALGLDEKWYEDFKKAENAFYNEVMEDNSEESPRTFSGDTKAVASPELQAKLDTYYSLAKGTGDRSRFLRANPDVLAYWEKQNDFTNSEREALGFKPIVDEEYKSSGSGGGGGNYSPYGLLGEVLNLGDNVKRFNPVSEKPYESIPADLEKQLRALFASSRGGRASVQLGAESRGTNA